MSSTSTPHYKIYTDGASRGNPGAAAYAFVIYHLDQEFYSAKGYLGHTTNNLAEYTALLKAWEYLATKITSEAKIQFFSDSELMVKQLNREYRIKDPRLQDMYQKVQELSASYALVTYTHIPRSQNRQADQLCNDVLDSQQSLL